MNINIQLDSGAVMPQYGTVGSAAVDLYTRSNDEYYIASNEHRLLGTGVSIEIPEGFVGLLFERSSLYKLGLELVNKVGVIDSDYRGEIKINVRNITEHMISVPPSSRLVQLLIVPVPNINFKETTQLTDTSRGHGGFGSTGHVKI